ncbi:lysophospholipid acyltransferase family protein [Gluconobacter kanchanaburiensis]|nr:lysophospholipid acyltransferase family protein [Gluconobacter kanchanaburiensis]MBF0861466.1 1-acyl-sn-glycerol-3-phosphate acyltransferase [Gluconobacter kanchanaburiensis]
MSILRGVLFNLYLFWITLFMGFGTIPIRLMKRQDLALSYAKLWARLVLAGFCRICSVRIEITGRENLPSGPLLIASQHQSFFDGFIWMTLVDRPDYIVKSELTRIPVVGPMLLLTGMIAIDRKAGPKALRNMMQATKAAHADNRQIIIFPEGTRTLPGERVSIQPGVIALARQADTPVVPVATDSGLFWDRNPWLKRPGILHVAIGRPLPVEQERRAFTKGLESAWDDLCTTHALPRDPVDNSVDLTNP